MSTVVYSKIKELEIQDKEVYEFGNWLRTFTDEPTWDYDEDDADNEDDTDESETPKNREGDSMQYPWGDFSYVVVPDTDAHVDEAESIASGLGSYDRYDIEDSDRTFFVVK
jgi:hypothetical protein